MEEQFSFKNLLDNITVSQRIGIVVGVVIIILIIILGIMLIPTDTGEDNLANEENSSQDDEGEYYSEQYVDPESTPIVGGDFNNINTYLPHAASDKTNYYDENENGVYDEGEFVEVSYSIEFNDDNGYIAISLPTCDDVESEKLARDYLQTIPTNVLSQYTIKIFGIYQEEPCE